MVNLNRQLICEATDLEKNRYLIRAIKYRKHSHTAIIFRYKTKIYAYVNHCMHMQRALDCQEDSVFDMTGKLLRCSMHGFVFEPSTGECLSPVCAGQKLQGIKLAECDGKVYFADKLVNLLT